MVALYCWQSGELMNTNPEESVSSSLPAEEILSKVQQLFAQLQLLREAGTNRHSKAYTALEAEIRAWADRYSEIGGMPSAPPP